MEILEAQGELLQKAAALFSGWNDTLILSCLQGMMGKVYVEGDAAAAYLGDFSLFVGTPSESLLRFKPNPNCGFLIMTPGNSDWEAKIPAVFGEKAKRTTRYAIRKDTQFQRAQLEAMKARLPQGFTRAHRTGS